MLKFGARASIVDTEKPALSSNPSEQPPVRPSQGEIAEFLLPLWTFLFENPEVGPDSDFFDLGGRSLHMAIVANHIRDRFGLEVMPLAIAEHPTVNALSSYLAAGGVDEWF